MAQTTQFADIYLLVTCRLEVARLTDSHRAGPVSAVHVSLLAKSTYLTVYMPLLASLLLAINLNHISG